MDPQDPTVKFETVVAAWDERERARVSIGLRLLTVIFPVVAAGSLFAAAISAWHQPFTPLLLFVTTGVPIAVGIRYLATHLSELPAFTTAFLSSMVIGLLLNASWTLPSVRGIAAEGVSETIMERALDDPSSGVVASVCRRILVNDPSPSRATAIADGLSADALLACIQALPADRKTDLSGTLLRRFDRLVAGQSDPSCADVEVVASLPLQRDALIDSMWSCASHEVPLATRTCCADRLRTLGSGQATATLAEADADTDRMRWLLDVAFVPARATEDSQHVGEALGLQGAKEAVFSSACEAAQTPDVDLMPHVRASLPAVCPGLEPEQAVAVTAAHWRDACREGADSFEVCIELARVMRHGVVEQAARSVAAARLGFRHARVSPGIVEGHAIEQAAEREGVERLRRLEDQLSSPDVVDESSLRAVRDIRSRLQQQSEREAMMRRFKLPGAD